MVWFKYPVILISVILVGIKADSCQVGEGYVGVYYKNGELQEELVYPVTELKTILVRPEETVLDDVEATTKDGVEITFAGVSVLSRIVRSKVINLIKRYGTDFKQVLLYNRIKEELRNFCANNTLDEIYDVKFLETVQAVKKEVDDAILRLGDGGLEILNLELRKPKIPKDIAENYRMVKLQWTQQLVEVQKQKTEMIKRESEMMKAIADAKLQKDIQQAMIEKEIIETEGRKTISELKSKILAAEEKNLADIAKYAKEREAEGNKALLSPEYLKMRVAESLANNTKVLFSGKDSEIGGLLEKILGA